MSDRERGMWSSVVMLAAEDLEFGQRGSSDHDDAVSFFTSGGRWRESREAIADMVDLHVDDIERLGRTVLDARQAGEADGPGDAPTRGPHDRDWWIARFKAQLLALEAA